jgi:P27 family predicted phage terminase small subunit
MARPKTPNAVLKKRGSKRIRHDEPEASEGEVMPTMELTPEGQKAWDRICAELVGIGVMSPTFAEIITQAADSLGDIEIANRDLHERGRISITERGETKNPSWTIKCSAKADAFRYLTALGLSPTAIGKLTATKKEEANEFADL